MEKEKEFEAEIDGKKVKAEIVGEDLQQEQQEEAYQKTVFYSSRNIMLPMILTGLAIVGTIIISLTVFIWALPVIIPVALIFWVANRFAGRR